MTWRSSERDRNDRLELEARLYRMFLLSFIFATLWVKGYLWWVFWIAVVLYLLETFVIPFVISVSEYSRQPSAPPQRPSPAPSAGPKSSAESPAEGGDDFREPRPSRSSPRRKSP